jgi:tRNA pseudouridine55 synthase
MTKHFGGTVELIGLRRTKVGSFNLRKSVTASKLSQSFAQGDWAQYLIPAPEALREQFPEIELTADEADRIRHGNQIATAYKLVSKPVGLHILVTEQGDFVALARARAAKEFTLPVEVEWQPVLVFYSPEMEIK